MSSPPTSTRVFASLAASLDGYIASAGGDIAWLNDSMRRDEDYGLTETMTRAGAYILGAKTFRESAGMIGGGAQKPPPTYVVTHAPPEDAPKGVTFYSGDLRQLVERAKAETDRDVHIFGGGDVVTQLIAADALNADGRTRAGLARRRRASVRQPRRVDASSAARLPLVRQRHRPARVRARRLSARRGLAPPRPGR